MPTKPVKSLMVALFVLTLLALPSLRALPVQALENNNGSDQIVEIADEAVKLDFSGAGQSYPDKAITLKLVITPQVDVAKTTVSWIYDKNMFKIEGASQDIIELTANQDKVLYKTFDPDTRYGFKVSDNLDFGVRVAAASYDRNYISVRKLTLHLNSDFENVPALPGYEQQKNTVTILYVLLGIAVGGLLIWLIVIGINRFRKYLNSD